MTEFKWDIAKIPVVWVKETVGSNPIIAKWWAADGDIFDVLRERRSDSDMEGLIGPFDSYSEANNYLAGGNDD